MGRTWNHVLILATAAALVLASCSAWQSIEWPDPPNEAFVTRVPQDSTSRRTADEAVSITRQYLAAMREQIAVPAIHRAADIDSAELISTDQAWTLDPCIPRRDTSFLVWVTKGKGDFLNMRDLAWSRHFGQFDEGFELACQGAAGTGTVVIDDSTGIILGVFPGDHDGLERPATTESEAPSR